MQVSQGASRHPRQKPPGQCWSKLPWVQRHEAQRPVQHLHIPKFIQWKVAHYLIHIIHVSAFRPWNDSFLGAHQAPSLAAWVSPWSHAAMMGKSDFSLSSLHHISARHQPRPRTERSRIVCGARIIIVAIYGKLLCCDYIENDSEKKKKKKNRNTSNNSLLIAQ